MIWPWSKIRQLEKQLLEEQRYVADLKSSLQTRQEWLLRYMVVVRGYNKGIWRLKQKIQRLEGKV